MAHPVRPVEHRTDEILVTRGDALPDEPRPTSDRTVSSTAAPPSPLAMVGALLALVALLAAIESRRRVLALGLALVILVLTFESAIHSVHHLGSSEESKCAVAVAAAHVQGTVGESVVAPAESTCVGAASQSLNPFGATRSRGAPGAVERHPPSQSARGRGRGLPIVESGRLVAHPGAPRSLRSRCSVSPVGAGWW